MPSSKTHGPVHPVQSLGDAVEHELDSPKLLDLITEQERLLRFKSFDSAAAWRVGNAIRGEYTTGFQQDTTGIVIHIELFSGHVLFSCAVGEPPFVGPDNW
jgi:uncharacterized protein (UPF0303 family)